jgi:anthranilate synthase
MPSDLSPSIRRFVTAGGVEVCCQREPVDAATELERVTTALDAERGLLLSSRYEVPGRYSRHDLALVNPPLVLEASGSRFQVRALNARGRVLVAACDDALRDCPACCVVERTPSALHGEVVSSAEPFSEEQRTRQPSLFSVLRRLCQHFAHPDEPRLGFYGAFGYDLVLQFEPLRLRLPRAASARDLVLYLPDELLVVDHCTGRAERLRYEFRRGEDGTDGLPRDGERRMYQPARGLQPADDHAPGEFEATVREAIAAFGRGDLFEVTPSQCFMRACPDAPSRVFRRLQRANPAPFGLLANLGQGEYLVGASPEMYVRVSGRRVETCPIAGTIARGADALGDAEQIRTLLGSAKDEAELTMCSDVDRNDKARVCDPGSVRLLGRRQIELYSRLIHTVDHIEGRLRPELDALDAFVTHCWAVTVTGAPKPDAMQFIEDHERSPRGFYGGAVGVVGFDGHLNTGLTLRTLHLRDGRAEVRAGATLLYDSVPQAEAAETRLKASALLTALEPEPEPEPDARALDAAQPSRARAPTAPPRVLLIDHRDSFVHTLGDYFRQAGAQVRTLRSGFDHRLLDDCAPALVVLSPGPGRPADFDCAGTLDALLARRLPVFGVCLGLQAMAEYFGGELGRLDVPVHGKASAIHLGESALFAGLPRELSVGRYHSLFARADRLPSCLRATARAADGCVMALEHRELPVYGVQFHPESILSAAGRHGLTLVRNALELAVARPAGRFA